MNPVNTQDIAAMLAAGKIVASGGKLYQMCGDCKKVVQINKRFFGSMHLCLTDDEREDIGLPRRHS